MDEAGAAVVIGIVAAIVVIAAATAIVLGRVLSHLLRTAGRSRFAPPDARAAVTAPDLDPFVHGSASEKRQAPRRPRNPIRVLIADATENAVPREGWVVDRSVGGLRLSTREAIPDDALLRVCAAEGSPNVWVEVRVRSCTKNKSGWTVGCQFVTSPPSHVLWTFG